MSRYDVLCVHTIVGRAPANAAHFSTNADGYVWQSRDTRYQSAANYYGNPRVIAVENEDMGPAYGAWNTNDGHAVPGFTAPQVESIAQICAWANRTHGIPLVLCPDSRPGSRGVAYHRQGISGNWAGFAYGGLVSGGEVWTRSPGKVCPGDRRITQVITQIIPRARQIAGLEQDMQADERSWLADIHEAVISGINWSTKHTKDQLYKVLGDVANRTVEAANAAGVRADAAAAKVDALAGTLASAAREAVATHLAANPVTVAVDYEALAKAVNDDADARARDRDPSTGPTS
jgi:hypothetical protein